ncbi:hypothetical protein M501DRAFT_935495 [Patellaria atrata CBS 101060]|uniref:Uncharacterized protein n=1 Tax=Patellaria atrata CBS 101060 TaxID=1346257 RepID=A0A9P4SAA3_9PEZI|nr:hypothetical protein M501DRAFT_935495 [Patellaria atrata CBS 101060]
MADQTTSCVQAADMIRNMGSNIGTELEEELGCIYNNSNCEVKNNVVFDVMDKYMT